MHNLTVSVVIPTQNRPEKIARAVDSVLTQRCLPREIIIVDDASSVSYQKVMSALRARSPVPLIYQKHESPTRAGSARNSGARLAKGSVLMFLDDDDAWLPGKICGQLDILGSRPEVGLVYSGRIVVNERGETLFAISPAAKGQLARKMLQKNLIGTTSSAAIRKDLFWQVGGFDPEMLALEDYEFWIRLARLTLIDFDPEFTVEWTIHDEVGAQMGSRPQIYERAVEQILDKHARDLIQLSWIERRKVHAWLYASLSDKYAPTGSFRQYICAMNSLIQYPSLTAFSRFLPYSIWMKLRRLIRR